QVRLRAERLGVADAAVELAAETAVEDILATLGHGKTPRLVVIDSIQTMWTDAVESAPGTVTQVRAAAQALIRFAKRSGAAVLVAPTSLGTPRRAVIGWDPNRLSMLLAVLEAHCGVRLGGHDVYLNVAGGLRIQEPAADLAAAAALVSSLANAPLPADAVYFGEISLSGAVRPVAQTAARLKEAAKLGFARALAPEAARGEALGEA